MTSLLLQLFQPNPELTPHPSIVTRDLRRISKTSIQDLIITNANQEILLTSDSVKFKKYPEYFSFSFNPNESPIPYWQGTVLEPNPKYFNFRVSPNSSSSIELFYSEIRGILVPSVRGDRLVKLYRYVA